MVSLYKNTVFIFEKYGVHPYSLFTMVNDLMTQTEK